MGRRIPAGKVEIDEEEHTGRRRSLKTERAKRVGSILNVLTYVKNLERIVSKDETASHFLALNFPGIYKRYGKTILIPQKKL